MIRILDLAKIAGAQFNGFDTTALEKDFLRFSQYKHGSVLNVKKPRMYSLQGAQIENLQKALDFLGVETSDGKTPEAIDMTGSFDYSDRGFLLFLSPQQIDADPITKSKVHLSPLLEKIFTEGSHMINDFPIHEAVLGRLNYKRGELDLKQAHLFPGKFRPGKYSISVDLNTPSGYVEKFIKFSEMLREFEENPEESMLNPSKIEEITRLGLQLRRNLGSLSRYHVPQSKTFSVETNSCVLDIANNPLFYLYSQSQNRNVLVYFGKSPFKEDSVPAGLTVLNGDEHQTTLQKLVELDIFRPSRTVLSQRVIDLNAVYESAKVSSSLPDEQFKNLERLLDSLRGIETSLLGMKEMGPRKEYLLRQYPELLEFMVCPSTEDPIVFDLLPKVSWNEGIRLYNNSSKFITEFNRADETAKKEMLNSVVANSMPGNYQNNDVNLYLYDNHREFCSANGISFNVT
jgi:hypothetical protein